MRLYYDVRFPARTLSDFCDIDSVEAEKVVRMCGSSKVFGWIDQLKSKSRGERKAEIQKLAGMDGYGTFAEFLTSERFLDGVELQRRSEIRRAAACARAIVDYLRDDKRDSTEMKKALVLTRMGSYIRLQDIEYLPPNTGLHEIKQAFRNRLEAHWQMCFPYLTADARQPRPAVISGAEPSYLHGSPRARALLGDTGVRPPAPERRP